MLETDQACYCVKVHLAKEAKADLDAIIDSVAMQMALTLTHCPALFDTQVELFEKRIEGFAELVSMNVDGGQNELTRLVMFHVLSMQYVERLKVWADFNNFEELLDLHDLRSSSWR